MLFSFVCLVQELVMLSKAKHLAMFLAVFPAKSQCEILHIRSG